MVDASLRRILALVPGWDPSRLAVTQLSGGITNRNYRVDAAGESFVLRVGGEGTALLGIDRRHEHAAAVAAAALGIGPEVVCFLEEEKALVTRFIAGSTLTPADASRPETLRRVVASIRRCHSGPAIPGVFSPFDTVRAYHARALDHAVAFPGSLPGALGTMGEIEATLGAAAGPGASRTPCHNDLLAANFIDDGSTVRIIDWEYAGMGDPFFDLGNFAVNQALTPEGCRALLEHYFGAVRARDLARLNLLRLASDLRESFWGFLQSGVSKLDFDFRRYALDHLERFLNNVEVPEFPCWLKEAKA